MGSCQGAEFLQDPRARMFLLPFPCLSCCCIVVSSHFGGRRGGWREQLHIPGLIQPRIPPPPTQNWDNLEERKGIPSGIPQEEEDQEGLQGEGSNPVKSLPLILSMAEGWGCSIHPAPVPGSLWAFPSIPAAPVPQRAGIQV